MSITVLYTCIWQCRVNDLLSWDTFSMGSKSNQQERQMNSMCIAHLETPWEQNVEKRGGIYNMYIVECISRNFIVKIWFQAYKKLEKNNQGKWNNKCKPLRQRLPEWLRPIRWLVRGMTAKGKTTAGTQQSFWP